MMFYQCQMGVNTMEDVADKMNIRELVEYERYCIGLRTMGCLSKLLL